MTTQYNAMTTVPVSITIVINEKIQKTNDCFQVTFTTAPDLTPVWCTVIKCGFFDSLNKSKYFHSMWAEGARKDGKRVPVDTDKVDDYELFQSTLQVHLTTGPEDQQRQDKQITVHIYHTKGKMSSVRTVLMQDFHRPQWVESQFEATKTMCPRDCLALVAVHQSVLYADVCVTFTFKYTIVLFSLPPCYLLQA